MSMKLFLLAVVLGALGVVFGFSSELPLAYAQEPPKNLKVYPPGTTKADLKKQMKVIAGALGVQCDFCHNLDDMSADTEHKNIARQMMRMTAEMNKKYFNGKPKVTCQTCHRGEKEPKE
jgi:Photosynthetic reaction centre cytochrome C subunit